MCTMKSNRSEYASRNQSYIPHLKRMTDPDPTLVLTKYAHNVCPRLAQIRTAHPCAARFQLSRYTATRPLPVNDPTQLVGARIDPIHRLPRAKSAHHSNLHKIRNRHDVFISDRDCKRTMRKFDGCPDVQLNVIREYAEEMIRDPDPYFTGTYDWYCSGSTMAVLHDGGDGKVDWLVHVQDADGLFNLLKLSELNVQPDGNIHLTSCARFDSVTSALAENGQIYEVHSILCAHRRDQRLLCVRQKNHISIVDTHSARIVNSIHSQVPYISAAFDAERQHIITIDVQRRLCVRSLNIEQQKEPLQTMLLGAAHYQSINITDPWTVVRPLAVNLQAIGDRETVHVFDTRMPYDALQQPYYAHTFRPYMDRCEMLTCLDVMPEVSEHFLLAGASHRLFALDTRMIGEPDSEAAESSRSDLIQWTHQLQSKPVMLSALRPTDDTTTLIAVAAHVPGDMRLIEMQPRSAGVETFIAQTPPYRPHSLSDSHQLVRRMGDGLDACSRVPQQMRASVTGVYLWQNRSAGNGAGSTLHLLQQSSAGDVFAQQLRPRDFSSDSIRMANQQTGGIRVAFQTWEEQLKSLVERSECIVDSAARPYVASDQTYFRGLADVMARNVCNPYGIGLTAETTTVADDVVLQRQDRWRTPLRKIRTYVDALAPSMLEIWQMSTDLETDGDGDATNATKSGADVSVVDNAALGIPSSAVAPAIATRAARISAWVNRSSTQTEALAEPNGEDPFNTQLSPIAARAKTQDCQDTAIADAPMMKRIARLEASLTDATQLMQETMASGRPDTVRRKNAKKRQRKFVGGF